MGDAMVVVSNRRPEPAVARPEEQLVRISEVPVPVEEVEAQVGALVGALGVWAEWVPAAELEV